MDKDNLPDGPINVLEKFLQQKGSVYKKRVIEVFRNIKNLRSGKYPIHPDQRRFTKAINYFGFNYPIEDWEIFWKKIIKKYKEALKFLRSDLRKT